MKVPAKGLYKTALGCLTAARAIIRNPKHWTQKNLAIDCNGSSVCEDDGEEALHNPTIKKQIRSENSVAFCAMGAVMFVNGPGERKARELLFKAAKQMHIEEYARDSREDWAHDWVEGADAVFYINDYKEWEVARKNTLTLFRRAIKLAKG